MKPLACLLAVCCVLMAAVSSCSGTGSDTELWTTIYTTTELNNRFDLLLNGQLRFGNDISALFDERVQTGFNYRPGPWLTLSPSYSYINNDQPGYVPYTENRLDLTAIVHFPVRELRVALENTCEWRFQNPFGGSFRLRDRLTLEHPIGPKPWGLSGYVSDEVFWDSDYDKWMRNRFYVGFKKDLLRNLKLDLYYMQQNDGYTTPGNLYVIGIALRFYFNGAELAYRPQRFFE